VTIDVLRFNEVNVNRARSGLIENRHIEHARHSPIARLAFQLAGQRPPRSMRAPLNLRRSLSASTLTAHCAFVSLLRS
jgi:hypothetical protein